MTYDESIVWLEEISLSLEQSYRGAKIQVLFSINGERWNEIPYLAISGVSYHDEIYARMTPQEGRALYAQLGVALEALE